MRYLLSLLALFLSITAFVPAIADDRSLPYRDYQVGQVWTYKTRAIDEGSLVKIGAIETIGDERVYHISVIDVRFGPSSEPLPIGHLPVSQETLDKSLLEQTETDKELPDPSEGIVIWREDKGGWFTLPLADIVQMIDDTY